MTLESTQKNKILNKNWLSLAETEQGRQKLSARHDSQLTQFIREHFLFGTILNDSDINPETQCEVGQQDNNLYVRIHYPIQTSAFMSTFGSGPVEVRDAYVSRTFLSFQLMRTPTIRFNEYETMTYPFSIPQQVQDSMGVDLHEGRDWRYIKSLEEALQAGKSTLGNVFKGASVDTGVETGARVDLSPDDITTLQRYHAHRDRLRRVLISEYDYLAIQTFDNSVFGNDMLSDVNVNGYSENKFRGVELIRTVKTDANDGDMMRAGNLYGFSEPEGIGRSYTLHGPKTHIEKKRNFTEIDTRIAFGFMWIVTKRCSKMELYNRGLTVAGEAKGSNTTSDDVWTSPEQVVERQFFHPGEFESPAYLGFT